MSADQIARAFGWTWVGQRDVGDTMPAWYDDYRTPDGRIVNTEPPYWQNAITHEIERLRSLEAETLRLARIGAWVAANSATVIDPDGHIVSASAKDYRRAALAADAPVEPPQGDAL